MKRAFFFALAAWALPQSALAQSTIPPLVTIVPKGPVVSLVQNASVEQAPDIANVDIGLVTRNRDRAAAIGASNAAIARIKADLIAKGVSAADITPGYFSAREEFDMDGTIRRRKGFVVESNLALKLHKLALLGDAMGAAIGAGATSVGNPEFDVENKEPILEKLMAEATAKARAKAMIHARINSYSGAKLLSVTDSDGHSSFQARKLTTFEERAPSTDLSPDITPRPVTISVSLAMAFELTN